MDESYSQQAEREIWEEIQKNDLDTCECGRIHEPPQRYKAEVTTSGDGGAYATNALLFATAEEAEIYARDLACRWTAVRDWRIRIATTEEAQTGALATASGLVR